MWSEIFSPRRWTKAWLTMSQWEWEKKTRSAQSPTAHYCRPRNTMCEETTNTFMIFLCICMNAVTYNSIVSFSMSWEIVKISSLALLIEGYTFFTLWTIRFVGQRQYERSIVLFVERVLVNLRYFCPMLRCGDEEIVKDEHFVSGCKVEV